MSPPSRPPAGLEPPDQPGQVRATSASLQATVRIDNRAEDAPTLTIGPGGPTGPAPSAPSPLLRRGVSLGRYVLLDLLGTGGMGSVYSAYDPDLDRKVAVKVLHADLASAEPGSRSQWRQRLLREAQAMARLSHPNVIAVYDVGLSGGHIFLAMEFVVGTTLRRWQAQRARPWREVLAAYVAAGRGLAAAHAAAIVHRDFKPDNVLVADDGRVKVTDFGIARAFDDLDLTPSQQALCAAPVASPGPGPATLLSTSMTQDGVVVGTPGYMAPEQYLAQPADARTDQFSFCVALYRALYDQRPFLGATYDEMRAGVLAGQVRPPPRDADVPLWVYRVLARGLQTRMDERYASMDELLKELGHDPAVRRRRVALGALALALPIASVLAARQLWPAPSDARCSGGDLKAREAWGAAAQAEVERAFRAAGKPYAGEAWRRTKATLDGYLGRWAAAHREACEATQVRHEQTAEAMTARIECLEARRREARALIRVLSEADAEVVERATRAAESLTGLESCDDVASLLAAEPPPRAPAARAELEAMRGDLATAKAYAGAGKYAAARQRGEALASRAGELGYQTLRAEALALVGRTATGMRDWGGAASAFKQAVWSAEAARADELKVHAQIGLMFASGELGRFDEAHDWGAYAAASVRRLGVGDAIEASRLSAEGWVFLRQGKNDEAIDYLRRSLATAERSPGLTPEDLGLVYNRLGNALAERREFDEAIALLKREETLLVRSLGTEHPALVANLNDTAAILLDRRRFSEAIPLLERARALSTEAGLRPSPLTIANLGEAHEGLGRDAEALDDYDSALAIATAAPSPQAWLVALLAVRRGRTLTRLGRVAEGQAACAEGLDNVRRTLPADHEFVADGLECSAAALLQLGRLREARDLLRQALPIRERIANDEKLTNLRMLLARTM